MSSGPGVEEEKQPVKEEQEEDTFEIVPSPSTREHDYWNVVVRKLGELDLSRRPVYQQLGVGGVAGWCVGNVFKKVGKVTALGIGGGLLLLQLASQSGYVTVNWRKINKDVRRVSKNFSERFEEYASSDEQKSKIAVYVEKGGQLVQNNIVVASGFAGGFLLGLAT